MDFLYYNYYYYSCVFFFFLSLSSSLSITPTSDPFPAGALPTESGYLPVAAGESSSALFFTFYEAQQPSSPHLNSTPLLVWLQGGPGCSSMLGNFFELGPFLLRPDTPSLRRNPFSWNLPFALLFIDNPIATGFSLAASPADIPTDQPAVAAHLSAALHSFFSSRPSLRPRPLFLTGESYAGKYIPHTAAFLLSRNPKLPPSRRINLVGLAIGDGLTHPVAQVATHAATGYFIGLLNARQRRHLEELQRTAVRLTLSANWTAAADARNAVLDWYQTAAGLATLQDYTSATGYDVGTVTEFLNRAEVKAALGVAEGVKWEPCSDAVGAAMAADVMKSEKAAVEAVLAGAGEKVRVLLYQGLYDIQDGVATTEAWVRELEWEGRRRFEAAERRVWEVDSERAGYVQAYGALTEVVVAGAGHLVPHDQGKRALEMMKGWVLQEGFFAAGNHT